MKKFFVLAMVIAVVLFRCLVVGQTMADFKEAFRKKAQEKKRQDSIRKSYNHPKFERWYGPKDYAIVFGEPLYYFCHYPYDGYGCGKDVAICSNLVEKFPVQTINVLRDIAHKIVYDRNGLKRSEMLKTFSQEELTKAITSIIDEKGQILPEVFKALCAWVSSMSATKYGQYDKDGGTKLSVVLLDDPEDYYAKKVQIGVLELTDAKGSFLTDFREIGIYFLTFSNDGEYIFNIKTSSIIESPKDFYSLP